MQLPNHEPLNDTELDRLSRFLRECKGGKAMNVEELDGFFAALIAGPELIMPSEYYTHVFGGGMGETCEFASLDDANAILQLLMRHWNTIATTLHGGEPYLPLLLEDGEGVAHANDWARGFMRGVDLRSESWGALVNSEECGGAILPMLVLCHEHDSDPELRPDPVTPEQRKDLIAHLATGLMQIYRYYLRRRGAGGASIGSSRPVKRDGAKVGRNDPCPCGSGKKFKLCHGSPELH